MVLIDRIPTVSATTRRRLELRDLASAKTSFRLTDTGAQARVVRVVHRHVAGRPSDMAKMSDGSAETRLQSECGADRSNARSKSTYKVPPPQYQGTTVLYGRRM